MIQEWNLGDPTMKVLESLGYFHIFYNFVVITLLTWFYYLLLKFLWQI